MQVEIMIGTLPMMKMSRKSEEDTRKIKILGNFSPSNHHGKNVYGIDGLCPTLCAGSVVKNGLNILVNREGNLSMDKKVIKNNFIKLDENRLMTTTKDGNALCVTTTRPTRPVGKKLTNYVLEKQIEDNFTEIEDGKYVTTDKERESCYAVTTRPRGRPLHKKQDNYVLEECIGSTQKHAARTDGTEAPTLTCAMGLGGGHIPMLKLRESTKKGYKEAKEGDGVELSRSHCSVRRGVSHDDSTGALNTQEGSWGTVTNDYRIRKLTPKECERLQAFPDDWTKYGKDDELISDTQRYKCCGNAVTTSVITAIVDEMFDGVNDVD